MYDKFFGIFIGISYVIVIIVIIFCAYSNDSIEEKEIKVGTYYIVDNPKENNWIIISPGGHAYQIERDENVIYVNDAKVIAAGL